MHIVDLAFVVTGDKIPADHGYPLYAALTQLIPELHAPKNTPEEGPARTTALWRHMAIHPINGRLSGERTLSLTPASRLRFRLPAEQIIILLPLAGKTLQLDGARIRIGIPTPQALKPAVALRCRMVTIKNHIEPESFLKAARQQLDALGIHGSAELATRNNPVSREGKYTTLEGRGPYIRRTLRVSDKEIVGYALSVFDLNAEESITLQEQGVGGRRRLGCGIFSPERH